MKHCPPRAGKIEAGRVDFGLHVQIMDRHRLGKLACPCVNDDQKIDVGNGILVVLRTTGFWGACSVKYLLFFPLLFYFPANRIHLKTTTNV